MENNNSSGSSVCTKIRQTLASNPAIGAIKHISILDHEPKPDTIKTSSAQTKPLTPPHHKHHKEASGAIPIKFDYSAPNGNKAVSAHVGNSERATKVAAKVELEPQSQYVPIQGKHPKKEGVQGHLRAQHVHMVHSEHQGKKPEDINDTFSDFIKRAKGKISRTVTNIGWRQSNYPAAEPDHEAHVVTNKNESHNKDHFSEFIHRAKKKIRTTTMVRKTGSMRRD